VKKITLTILLLLSVLAWAGSNPNPADYTITVHVNKSYYCAHGEQKVTVVIDGKNYELAANGERTLLALGDYKAKLVKDEHKGMYSFHQEYEFLFPDQRTKKFWVSGQSE
jgi:hypothetical protein